MLVTQPKHILMTADTFGGVWTYSVELCRALSSKGIHVSLATMGRPLGRERAREFRDLRNAELYESNFRLEWMDDPWRDVDAAGDWLLSLASDIGADLVHLNGYSHAALQWKIPSVVVGHSCVCSWWNAVKKEPAPSAYDEYRQRATRGLLAADLVIAPSASMLSELERWYDVKFQGIVIPNGRSSAAFPQGAKLDMIFSSGRLWDEGKNVQPLAHIAKKLAWPVYIAGETAGPKSRVEPSAEVVWLGYLSESQIAPWYSRAAIYVHPAKYEPFGLSVLEAALAGCALVLSDIPSLRENWDGAALFVSPDQGTALLPAIDELIQNSSLRKTLQGRASARARKFSPRMMARHYVEAYGRASVNFPKRSDPSLRRTC